MMKFSVPVVAVTAVISIAVPVSIGSAAPAAAAVVTPPAPSGFAGPATQVEPAPGLSPAISKSTSQFTSRNWDGYITYASTEGTDFNKVKATWIQPTVTCQAADAWTVFWIGFDGWFNDTVEQGGSSARCSTVGAAPQYTLWWEMYPTNSIQSVLTINPGDEVTASVAYSTTKAQFTISVKDVTTKKSFTKSELCATGLVCQRSSTDFITEDVGEFGTGGYFPLADYKTMSYSGAGATNTAGKSGSISATAWRNGAVTEEAGGTTYATVSPLATSGTSFSTTWAHQ